MITFTADSEEMKIEIEYTFNASSLGGQNLVTFEELYDLSNEDEPIKVAEHKDIDDEGQTVLITERIISIHTTATSEDGKKEIEAGKDVTIIDTVTLDGLEIGTKYDNMRIVMSLTVDVDVTKLIKFTKNNGLKFYPTMIWIVSKSC